jgi:hypothetical protein
MVKCAVGINGDSQHINKENYEELCKSGEVYEIPPMNSPIKLFCDIDIYDVDWTYQKADEGIESVIFLAIEQVELVTRALGRTDELKYTVCNSSSTSFKCSKSDKQKWKISYHIIFENVMATKPQQSIIFKFLNKVLDEKTTSWKKYFPPNSKFFDTSVYGIEKFRAVYVSKKGENRPLVIEEGTFEGSVISDFFPENYFVIDEECENFLEIKGLEMSVPSTSSSGENWENEFLVSQYIEKGLLTKYAKDYGDWFEIVSTICQIFDENTAWNFVDAFSKLSTNYDEYGNRRWFNKFIGTKKGDFGIKNIRAKAMKVNKKIYTEIEAEKKLLKQEKAEEEKKRKRQLRNQITTLNSETNSITTCETGETDELDCVSNDNDAGIVMLNALRDILIYQKGQIFYKNNYVWEYDMNMIESVLINYILMSDLKCPPTYSEKDGDVITTQANYCTSLKKAKDVYQVLIHKLKVSENVDIYEKFHTTTKNRLCFEDGVLDFKARKFYRWEEINFEYYTTTMIRRPFASYFENPDTTIQKDIHEKVFTNLFGEKTPLAYHFLSRAITANVEDKLWASYLGNRDCGKGVLYDLLKNSFNDYVGTFELGNILCHRQQDISEVSRKLYWLIDLQFTRIAMSQETPAKNTGLKLMGKMMKKLAGGGDEHVARRNYDRYDTHFKIDSTFMMLGNDELIVDTPDTNQKRIEFSSVVQFKSKEQIDKMANDGIDRKIINKFKIRDDNIKNLIKTEEYANAMVMLLFNNWKSTPCEFSREEDEYSDDFAVEILKKFEITTSSSDVVMVEIVKSLFDDSKKVLEELIHMGCKKVKSTTGLIRNKWVMTNLKKRVIEEVE